MIRTPMIIVCICAILFSCTTDIENNSPSLQATIDGEVFRTSVRKAILNEDGTLTISGNSNEESISFTTASSDMGKHKTNTTTNRAKFQSNGKSFQDDVNTNGEVIITNISNNEVSGTFIFEDLMTDKGASRSFYQGWFYKIPLEDASIIAEETPNPNENPCLLDASLTASIDGTVLITDDHNATVFGVQDVSILIAARSEDGEEITMIFPIDAAPGSYSFAGSGDYSATYSVSNDKASAVSGTLTISFHNTETRCISGSFQFETGTGIAVTEGAFEYGY